MLELNQLMLKEVVGGGCVCGCDPNGPWNSGFWVSSPQECYARCGTPMARCFSA